MQYWIIYFLILIAVISLFSIAFVLTRRQKKWSSSTRTLVENILLALQVLFLTFMAIEFFFKVFFAQSDGFRYTLASRNWYERYWQEN